MFLEIIMSQELFVFFRLRRKLTKKEPKIKSNKKDKKTKNKKQEPKIAIKKLNHQMSQPKIWHPLPKLQKPDLPRRQYPISQRNPLRRPTLSVHQMFHWE